MVEEEEAESEEEKKEESLPEGLECLVTDLIKFNGDNWLTIKNVIDTLQLNFEEYLEVEKKINLNSQNNKGV